MITLSIFNDFCSWWIFWWILPFILGGLLGWAIYGNWKHLYQEEEKKTVDLNNRVDTLQKQNQDLKKSGGSSLATHRDLEGKLLDYERRERLYKSELRSKDYEIDKLKVDIEQRKKNEKTSTERTTLQTDDLASKKTIVPIPTSISPAEYGVVDTNDLTDTDQEKSSLENNMQVIEGIGPRMESVLFENGIHNWATLSNYTATEIKEILDKYGSKFTIINPKHWPMQASLAAGGNWEELIRYQKSIDSNVNLPKSKAETLLAKMGLLSVNESTNIDLKVFEGIGIEMETILKNNRIGTWEELAVTPIVKLRGILEEANPKNNQVNPASWPKQAQLALAGKTKMLQEYQDFLRSNK